MKLLRAFYSVKNFACNAIADIERARHSPPPPLPPPPPRKTCSAFRISLSQRHGSGTRERERDDIVGIRNFHRVEHNPRRDERTRIGASPIRHGGGEKEREREKTSERSSRIANLRLHRIRRDTGILITGISFRCASHEINAQKRIS